MASVPDWTTDGVTQFLRRITGRSQEAPPAARSMVYALCEEYRRFDLWAAYYAFRLDPRAPNWRRLRNRNVPWLREQTVEDLVRRLYPWNGKGTPDANTVGLALVSAPSAPAVPFKKKR